MSFKRAILSFALLVFCPALCLAQAWMTGFNYRKKITIDKNKVIAREERFSATNVLYHDLVNFPVLIELTDRDLIYNNGACGNRIQNIDGKDISFALSTAPTVPLNFQLEHYNPATGKLTCWVKIAALSGNNTSSLPTAVYLYYGSPGALHNPKSLSALNTWNSDYKKVWHMAEASSEAGIHQMNLPLAGSSTFGAGKIAGSTKFNGTSDYYNAGLETSTNVTISGWVKLNSIGTEQMIVTNDSTGVGGYQFKINAAGKLAFETFRASFPVSTLVGNLTTLQVNRWHHVCVTINGTSVTIFLDNAPVFGTVSPLIRLGPGGSVRVGGSKQGNRHFDGEIDELSIQSLQVGVEWLKTRYANQNEPSGFYTVSVEEYNPAGFSRFTGTNNQWSVPTNWTGNTIPAANANILIPSGKNVLFPGGSSFNKLIIEQGATLTVGSNLTVSCFVQVATGGSLRINDAAILTFGGQVSNNGNIVSSGSKGQIRFTGNQTSQEYSGSGTMKIHTMENEQSHTGNVLFFGAVVQITGFLDLKNGLLDANGKLTLLSTSQTATAALLPISTGAAGIMGEVIVQQYISGSYLSPATARGWRLLSSPVYTSGPGGTKKYGIQALKDAMFITGPGGTTGGFDPSPQNGGTVYTHNQQLQGTLSQKYVAIRSSDEEIEMGRGIYVFSRGSRHAANAFAAQIATQPFANPEPYLINHVGEVFTGVLRLPLSNNDSGKPGDGFNLLGNPYPASLRWGDIATEGTTRFVWQFDPLNNAYVVDDSPNIIIPSGSGFFVKVSSGQASGALTFTEHSKFTNIASSLPVLQAINIVSGSADPPDFSLKVQLSKGKFEQSYVLKLKESGFDGVSDADALKIGDGYVSISALVNEQRLSVDERAFLPGGKMIDLSVNGVDSGLHRLDFELPVNASDLEIKLIDNYLNLKKTIDKTNLSYSFLMDKNPGSQGERRFKLSIKQAVVKPFTEAQIKIYPNPFTEKINVLANSSLAEEVEVILTDLMGRVLIREIATLRVGTFDVNTQHVGKGLYLLQVINRQTKKLVTTLKLVKL